MIAYKLLALYSNAWGHMIMCKQIIIIKQEELLETL